MTVKIDLTQGKFALIDADDYDLVSPHRWRPHPNGNTSYATRIPHTARVLMHTLITGWSLVDHINGDGLDNRRENLRQATVAQNQWNARVRKQAKTSRFKGVFLHGGKYWRAAIKRGGKTRTLGRHPTEVDAALAYDAAARELFGEFAALNFAGPGERSAHEF
jgi:hypothetical protein